MTFKCCVPGCNGNYKNGPRVGLFSFPKDKTLHSKWINAIGGPDFKPKKFSKVCQLHFAEEDLIRVSCQKDSITGQIYSVVLKHARRKEGSIPTLFPAKVDCAPRQLFDEATNTVDSILRAGKLSRDNQLKIKLLGRPTPVLNMEYTEEAEKQDTKRFSKDIYSHHYWICGCPFRNALFCFPCLLFFQTSVDSIWNTVGETDLINLQQSINNHKTSKNHLSACVYLSLLGRRRLYQLNPSEMQEIARHNQTVAQNRQLLSKIINWLKFRATFALETGTHNEKYIFKNDLFKDKIDYNSDLDNLLKSSKSTLFKGSSEDFQNEVLYCMKAVCEEEICTQISEAEFLAIECNETNNIGNECELVLTLRYIYRRKTVERFWCFFNVMDDTATLTSSIQAQLDHILKDNNDKLIAQSYKLSRIPSEQIADVEVKMLEKYPAAHVIHSYTNEMDLLLQSLPRRNGNFRMFFSKLFEFPRFFSKSKNVCDVVERICKAKLTRIPPKSWTCNKKLVHIVFANKEDLSLCLREISNECERVSIVRKAIALRKILNDPDFTFWLSYFDKLNPYIEVLLQHFQSKDTLNDDYKTNLINGSQCYVMYLGV
ncbi:hypothetical protein WA026_003301 [Henosepilachna vigintioctopunctata]|uniref:THAP-type domain-containing protein n=1 Tax=Henosepilachna vigintioctopunctata TaxID=420089 RepID=A0AAW1THC3_9CUCU